jgi:transposase, IS5 family
LFVFFHATFSLKKCCTSILSAPIQKQYEYGNKVSIAATATSNIIVSVVSHRHNLHDSKALPDILAHSKTSRGKPINIAVCDRGYKRPKTVGTTQIILPAPPLKWDKRYQRRVAIEPIIGHLKADYRLSRNFLKGITGDLINLLMVALAWNLSLWMRAFLASFLGTAQQQKTSCCHLYPPTRLH